jgi:hypothetical protein
MRHIFLPSTVATSALGVSEAAAAARLVALSCFALRAAPGLSRTASGTVDLTPIATAADQHLGATARAQKESGRSLHPHSRSSRRALDEILNE